ncbi:hypothetical protein [Cryptosporangium sp. NPDC051539]|uniref:hypothetical protein n=1 Tax=Cryptosporangium sp. NPDC051539 TaxID=3363962 RepID=UPI003791AEFB
MIVLIREALRSMRGPLTAAVMIAGGAILYIVRASAVVQNQLDAAGVPDCLDPNVCYPHGSALDAVFGMELVAATVPALIGLVLGVPLVRRRSSLVASLAGALVAGVVLTGAVALTHRLLGARYTVLANDTYELLQMLHLNNVGFMVMLTAAITALAAVFGLTTGRLVPTVVLSVVGWPCAVIVGYLGVGLLSIPLLAFGSSDGSGSGSGSFADDIGFADGVGYTAGAVLAVGVAALVLLARRRTPR